MIKLVVVGLLEGVEAFADDHVAGGAGAREFARMLDLDAVRKERAGQVLTRSSLKDEAFRAKRFVGEHCHFRHFITLPSECSSESSIVLGFVFGLLVEHLVVDTHAREGFADRTVHAALGQSLGALRKGLDARLDRLDVVGDDERGEAFDKRVDLGALGIVKQVAVGGECGMRGLEKPAGLDRCSRSSRACMSSSALPLPSCSMRTMSSSERP